MPTATSGTNTTQAASTAFVQAAVSAAVAGLLEFKSDQDCSANPNYPAAAKGDVYYVSVAGKIGGASGKSVDIGDAIVCKADNAGGTEASVGTSWFVLEKNLAGALLSANNLSDIGNAATALSNLGAAAASHTHAIADTTGLQTALDGKASTSHTHAQSDVTNLTTDLAAKAPLASPTFTGTPLVPTASGGTNTTQAASTAFVQAAVSAAVAGLLEFKSDQDCSANPNYPAAAKGDVYYVSVAGKIGGASGKSVDIGDAIVCKADNAGGTEASVGTSWFVLEKNLAGALLSANNLSDIGNAATALSNLGAAAASHTHAIADTTGLQTALDGKASTSHTHAQSDVTNLTTDLAAKAPLASPTFTGTPIVPTATAGTNTTQAASTAFVTTAVRTATTPGLRASRYYGSFPAAAVTTFALTANRLYYFPFFCPDSTTFTRIGINVTSTAAGNARLGIYANSNGVPSGAPILDAGTVDVSTTGEKEIVISQALGVGWYWLAIVSDVAPTLTAENIATAVLLCNVGSLSGSAGNVTHVQQTFTYAALPTPSSITGANLTTPPRIWLRL